MELAYSRELYKYKLTFLNKQIYTSIHNSDNISLRLLQSVNTLNSNDPKKQITSIAESLYLDATLNFLRFAAKHYTRCLNSSAVVSAMGSYTQLYFAYSKHCGGKLFEGKIIGAMDSLWQV